MGPCWLKAGHALKGICEPGPGQRGVPGDIESWAASGGWQGACSSWGVGAVVAISVLCGMVLVAAQACRCCWWPLQGPDPPVPLYPRPPNASTPLHSPVPLHPCTPKGLYTPHPQCLYTPDPTVPLYPRTPEGLYSPIPPRASITQTPQCLYTPRTPAQQWGDTGECSAWLLGCPSTTPAACVLSKSQQGLRLKSGYGS